MLDDNQSSALPCGIALLISFLILLILLGAFALMIPTP